MSDTQKKMQALCSEYTRTELTEEQAGKDPLKLFSVWMSDAVNSVCPEPNAMILSTADTRGKPSARTVLLKSFSEDGFVFYSNYRSQKGRELAQNPNASLLFYWGELQRQVRLEGKVAKLDRKASADYFNSRPLDSRLGAWSSPQSEMITNRKILAEKFNEMQSKFNTGDVPLPEFWGGYRLIPQLIEFWQGRKNRLHDRLRYNRHRQQWLIERLAP